MGQVDEASDAELLAAHVSGDPDAFTVLVQRHRDRLWGLALRTTNDPEEAADALQDALISAFRNAGQFRGESAVTTWLHRIVVNASLDRLRRRAVRIAVPLPEDEADHRALIADDVLSNRELRMELLTALADLPEDQRKAILLVDVEGWSVEEAGEMLGCPTGTVKSRCSRGRARLAKALAHLRNQEGEDPVIPRDEPAQPGPAAPAQGEGVIRNGQ